MVAMHPKQGMFPGIFTHPIHVHSSRKFQGLTLRGMRIYVPSCSTNGQADEEIWQVPESAKTAKTANTFWILLMLAASTASTCPWQWCCAASALQLLNNEVQE